MNRQTIEGGLAEGFGAERMTEERTPPLLCFEQVDQLPPLKRHEYALCQVIHPAPLFLFKLYLLQKNTGGAQKKIGQIKKNNNKTTELFFLCPRRFFCGVRGVFRAPELLMPSSEETALINIHLNNPNLILCWRESRNI